MRFQFAACRGEQQKLGKMKFAVNFKRNSERIEFEIHSMD
jgi:hypothetical protein